MLSSSFNNQVHFSKSNNGTFVKNITLAQSKAEIYPEKSFLLILFVLNLESNYCNQGSIFIIVALSLLRPITTERYPDASRLGNTLLYYFLARAAQK